MEPSSVTIPQGTCGYVFSSYFTPTLYSAPSLIFTVSGRQQINVSGSLLAVGLSAPVVCASEPCYSLGGLSVAFRLSNSNSINGTIVRIAPGLSNGAGNVTLGLPPLPVGSWPLMLTSACKSLLALSLLFIRLRQSLCSFRVWLCEKPSVSIVKSRHLDFCRPHCLCSHWLLQFLGGVHRQHLRVRFPSLASWLNLQPILSWMDHDRHVLSHFLSHLF